MFLISDRIETSTTRPALLQILRSLIHGVWQSEISLRNGLVVNRISAKVDLLRHRHFFLRFRQLKWFFVLRYTNQINKMELT